MSFFANRAPVKKVGQICTGLELQYSTDIYTLELSCMQFKELHKLHKYFIRNILAATVSSLLFAKAFFLIFVNLSLRTFIVLH